MLSKLPLIEVEYLEGELRRCFEREAIPNALVYIDDEANVHRLELLIRNVRDKLTGGYPITLSDCSIGGVQGTVDHKFRPGSRVQIRARSAKSGEWLFSCNFQIRSRRHEVIEEDALGVEEEVFIFGSTVDDSMAHDSRFVYHYGLQFVPGDAEENEDLNLLYKAYLDTLYVAHKVSVQVRESGA